MNLDEHLKQVVKTAITFKGQDIFIKVDHKPRVKAGGAVHEINCESLNSEQVQDLARSLMTEYQWAVLERDKSADFAFSVDGFDYRFRGNAFYQQSELSLVLRILWKGIPNFDELNLPSILKQVAIQKSGIILLAGVVSSGKTTTIAAMINEMNNNSQRHVITVEDPVEFVYESNKCLIQQREIGTDAHDFNSALRYVVRQSPDVILIGEMRDAETLRFALNAAEVGRLVISTVHAQTVSQIFDRLMGFFEPENRDDVLRHFAQNMTCIAVQKLVPGTDGKSMVPAIEVMLGTYTLKQLAKEKRFDQISQAIINSNNEGMQTMDQSLLRLCQSEMISRETALENAVRPKEIENELKGIKLDVGGKILGK